VSRPTKRYEAERRSRPATIGDIEDMRPDPDAEPGLPIEWYQSELRACRNRITDLEHMIADLLSYHPDTVGGEQ
jgi:hypothetical protein